MSNLVKDFDFVLDLAKFDESGRIWVTSFKGARACRRWRRPSLRRTLSTKTFTSPKADSRRWGTCTRRSLTRSLGRRQICGIKNVRTDEDVVKLCGAIATGKLVKLEKLRLSGNQIKHAGYRARGGGGKLPQLKDLTLGNNHEIGDVGVAAPRRRWQQAADRDSTSWTTSTSPSKPRTPSRPPCPTVMWCGDFGALMCT